MGRRLGVNIGPLRHPETLQTVTLFAGSEVPEWAAEGLADRDDIWETDEVTSDVADDGDGRPPLSGRGSGKGAWADYAEELGIDVPEDATRDDIVALVDAHEG